LEIQTQLFGNPNTTITHYPPIISSLYKRDYCFPKK